MGGLKDKLDRTLAKRNKLESKVQVLTQGYINREVKLRDKVESLLKENEELRIQKDVLSLAAIQEKRALAERLLEMEKHH